MEEGTSVKAQGIRDKGQGTRKVQVISAKHLRRRKAELTIQFHSYHAAKIELPVFHKKMRPLFQLAIGNRQTRRKFGDPSVCVAAVSGENLIAQTRFINLIFGLGL